MDGIAQGISPEATETRSLGGYRRLVRLMGVCAYADMAGFDLQALDTGSYAMVDSAYKPATCFLTGRETENDLIGTGRNERRYGSAVSRKHLSEKFRRWRDGNVMNHVKALDDVRAGNYARIDPLDDGAWANSGEKATGRRTKAGTYMSMTILGDLTGWVESVLVRDMCHQRLHDVCSALEEHLTDAGIDAIQAAVDYSIERKAARKSRNAPITAREKA